MPKLSDTMTEGTLVSWKKKVGDEVTAGEVLAEIETDKATMEFQAYDAGTVLRILVGDGESAALGAPIAIVGDQGEQVDGTAPAAGAATETAAEEEQPPAPPEEASVEDKAPPPPPRPASNGSATGAALRVSPIARRMAVSLSVTRS